MKRIPYRHIDIQVFNSAAEERSGPLVCGQICHLQIQQTF